MRRMPHLRNAALLRTMHRESARRGAVRATDEIHLQLAGELDLAVTPALRDAMLAAAERPAEARLVLDLTDVTLLDASALSAIAAATRTYGEVELRNPTPHNRRVLAVGGMDQVARIT